VKQRNLRKCPTTSTTISGKHQYPLIFSKKHSKKNDTKNSRVPKEEKEDMMQGLWLNNPKNY
jgi:hypothetical protein